MTAMAYSSREGIYVKNMLSELGFEKEFNSVPLFGNSTGALNIAGNSPFSLRAEHIALRLF